MSKRYNFSMEVTSVFKKRYLLCPKWLKRIKKGKGWISGQSLFLCKFLPSSHMVFLLLLSVINRRRHD